jgi:hypothetical protein
VKLSNEDNEKLLLKLRGRTYSTGLDSSTTFQVVNSLRQYVHVFNETVVISLLQPAHVRPIFLTH